MGNIYRVHNRIPLRMKLAGLLLAGSMSMMNAATSYSQSTRLSLEIKNESIQNVLEEIESQSDFSFFYDTKQINTSERVSIKSSEKDIFAILDDLFRDSNISYKVLDKNIILSVKGTANSTTVPGRLSAYHASGMYIKADNRPFNVLFLKSADYLLVFC